MQMSDLGRPLHLLIICHRHFIFFVLCLFGNFSQHSSLDATSGADTCSIGNGTCAGKHALPSEEVKPDGVIAAGAWEARIGRPCGCQFRTPSTITIENCLDGDGRDSGNRAVEATIHGNRVLAISRLNRRMHAPFRFAAALNSAHLTAFGHHFYLERAEDQYRNGVFFEGSLRDDRIAQVDLLARKLEELQQKADASFDWLLWLDPGAVIVTDEDLLRRVLASYAADSKTHIIVCQHGQKQRKALSHGNSPDSGVILLKNAKWTSGFLAVWQRELSFMVKNGLDDIDAALARAVKLARDLGGQVAVVELPPGMISANLRSHSEADARQDALVHLRGAPDEVCEHFFHAAWTWACRRPGGLGGDAPAVLQRFHREALENGIRQMADPKAPNPYAPHTLHQSGRTLPKEDHAEAIVDALAEYAKASAQTALRTGTETLVAQAKELVKLAIRGYQFSFGHVEHPKMIKCKEKLWQLQHVQIAGHV